MLSRFLAKVNSFCGGGGMAFVGAYECAPVAPAIGKIFSMYHSHCQPLLQKASWGGFSETKRETDQLFWQWIMDETSFFLMKMHLQINHQLPYLSFSIHCDVCTSPNLLFTLWCIPVNT